MDYAAFLPHNLPQWDNMRHAKLFCVSEWACLGLSSLERADPPFRSTGRRVRPYSYYIDILVSIAFLEPKLLELKPTSLSRVAQLKLDFFNMLSHSTTRPNFTSVPHDRTQDLFGSLSSVV